MSDATDFLRTPIWYPVLAGHTFLTSFVKLRSDSIAALIAGKSSVDDDPPNLAVKAVIEDLRQPMANIPGNCFVTVDRCAPTDTERVPVQARGGSFPRRVRGSSSVARESAGIRPTLARWNTSVCAPSGA